MPTLRVISEEEMRQIHHESIEILEQIGVVIHHESTLRDLERAGALVDFQKRKVRIPSDLTDESIRRCPRSRILAGRSSESDLNLQLGKTYTRAASGSIYVIDSRTGGHREATSEDVRDFTRVQEHLDNISFCGGSPYPSDVHPAMRDVYQIKIMLENTTKHIRFQPLSGEGLDCAVKMAGIVVGKEENLNKRPIISCITAPTSPLVYSREQTEIIVRCGKYGIPAMLGSTPTVGATGPVTLAGSLVLQNAEILAGIVLSEAVNPGAPVSYGPRMPTMDMRTGISTWGAIEFGLAAAAGAQMGQFYGIETDLYGSTTDSKVTDEQAAVERTFNALLPALAGANIINGAGVLESILTVSLEQLMIDNEMFGMMFRMLRGIQIDETTMAKDVIRRVGPGGNFLIEKHTKEHYKAEHFIPELFDRRTRETWEKTGRKDVVTAAKEKVIKILGEHEVPHLDKDVTRRMELILEEAKKNIDSGSIETI